MLTFSEAKSITPTLRCKALFLFNSEKKMEVAKLFPTLRCNGNGIWLAFSL